LYYNILYIKNMKSSYILIAIIFIGFFLYSRKKSNIPKISSQNGLKLLNDENHKFLDVRTDSEYSNGHIPKSKHIPLQELQDRVSEIEQFKNKNIIVYCRSGARSSKATNILLEKGFKVLNLSGGVMSWKGELEK
jgi:rhodanese-related sulfurtransferase